MLQLIGILIVAVGFAVRANPLLVVVAAGVATGVVAGIPLHAIVERFGALFVESRYMLLPVALMVPVVGLLERYGLRERAEALIRQARAATAGRVLLLYTAIRQISISIGVNIGGHAGAVRPVVAPLAEGAARARHGELPERTVEAIRAHAAAAENVGNFFGEDIFIAVGAILLMKGFFDGIGVDVSVWAMALWGLPTALVAFLVMWWRAHALDRRIEREAERVLPAEESRQ
jgi:uncharacterized membrane protein